MNQTTLSAVSRREASDGQGDGQGGQAQGTQEGLLRVCTLSSVRSPSLPLLSSPCHPASSATLDCWQGKGSLFVNRDHNIAQRASRPDRRTALLTESRTLMSRTSLATFHRVAVDMATCKKLVRIVTYVCLARVHASSDRKDSLPPTGRRSATPASTSASARSLCATRTRCTTTPRWKLCAASASSPARLILLGATSLASRGFLLPLCCV